MFVEVGDPLGAALVEPVEEGTQVLPQGLDAGRGKPCACRDRSLQRADGRVRGQDEVDEVAKACLLYTSRCV